MIHVDSAVFAEKISAYIKTRAFTVRHYVVDVSFPASTAASFEETAIVPSSGTVTLDRVRYDTDKEYSEQAEGGTSNHGTYYVRRWLPLSELIKRKEDIACNTSWKSTYLR